MNILDADLTLLELEELLELEMRNEEKDIRIIGDLDLSYEDYKYMILRLKGLTKYRWNMEVFEKYKLCIITSWVFTLRYETDKNFMYDKVKRLLNGLQQHHLRYCIKMCASAFEEYGIETYGIDTQTLEGIFELSAIHAGIPRQVQHEFYQLLDDSLNYSNLKFLESDLFDRLPPRLQEIYQFIDSRHQKRIIYVLREIYMDYKIGKCSLDEVLNRYSETSRKFIEDSYYWCIKYEKNKNRLIGAR